MSTLTSTSYALIYFVYGLAFFCLGFALFIRVRAISHEGTSQGLRWVAAFGLLHGLSEWTDMARYFGVTAGVLDLAEPILAALSYAALMRAGLGWTVERSRLVPLVRVAPAACLVLWGLVAAAAPGNLGGEIAAQYLLGIPAAVSVAFGLMNRREMFGDDRRGRLLLWSSVLGFALYAATTAFSSPGGFFPASVLNYPAFEALTGTPIQLWRAGAAVLITAAFLLALDRFDRYEMDKLAEQANEAREELDLNQRRTQALIDNALDVITILGPDGTIIFESPSIERILGYTPDELLGQSAFNFIHPDDLPSVAETFQQVLAESGRTESSQFRFRHKDESWRHLESIGRNLLQESSVEGIVINSRDITDRKRAEELTTRLGRIVEDSVNEIFVFDSNTLKFVQVNRGARENLGYSMDELRELTPVDLKPEITMQAFQELIRPLEDGDKDHIAFETVHQRKDGSRYDVEVRLQLMRTETPPVFFAVIQDVTERKKTVAQLHQAQKMEAVGQLTGGVAHDFNNLLTVVQGNLELLSEELGDQASARSLTDAAIRAAGRGANLTHRLLAFSRKQALRPVALNLNDLISEMTSLLQRAVGETIDIHSTVANELWHALADPGQVETALLNLALNARDAMPDGGKLTIETSNVRFDDEYAKAQADIAAGEYVQITVSDDGDGIPAEALEHVFEPFYTTKDVGEGSGLGLSMVYGFAKQSGGHVTIYSEADRGTTVKLYLPRTTPEAVQAEPDATPDEPNAGEETILVVEDDPEVRTLVITLLGNLGYEVLEAGDGASAIAAMKSRSRIDLLFTDVVLAGGMSGPQVAEEAKRIHPAMKILFMSGYPREAIVRHGQLNQGADLLNKPFRKADLARKIREVLRTAA